MPIIKSAQKRVRQAEKRLSRNRGEKRQLRDKLKAFTAAIEDKKLAEVEKAQKALQSQIDKMVKKNILHKNTAARRKSAFSKQAKEAGAKVSKAATTKKATPAKKPAAKKAPVKKPAAKKTPAKK